MLVAIQLRYVGDDRDWKDISINSYLPVVVSENQLDANIEKRVRSLYRYEKDLVEVAYSKKDTQDRHIISF